MRKVRVDVSHPNGKRTNVNPAIWVVITAYIRPKGLHSTVYWLRREPTGNYLRTKPTRGEAYNEPSVG